VIAGHRDEVVGYVSSFGYLACHACASKMYLSCRPLERKDATDEDKLCDHCGNALAPNSKQETRP